MLRLWCGGWIWASKVVVLFIFGCGLGGLSFEVGAPVCGQRSGAESLRFGTVRV